MKDIDDTKMREDAARYRHLINKTIITWDLTHTDAGAEDKDVWITAEGFGETPNINELNLFLDKEIAKNNKKKYFRLLDSYVPCTYSKYASIGDILEFDHWSDDKTHAWLHVGFGHTIKIKPEHLEEIQPSLF